MISFPLPSFPLTPFAFFELSTVYNKHLFILQVESPIICPLLEEMDAYGLFQVDDSWILPASYLSVGSIFM